MKLSEAEKWLVQRDREKRAADKAAAMEDLRVERDAAKAKVAELSSMIAGKTMPPCRCSYTYDCPRRAFGFGGECDDVY